MISARSILLTNRLTVIPSTSWPLKGRSAATAWSPYLCSSDKVRPRVWNTGPSFLPQGPLSVWLASFSAALSTCSRSSAAGHHFAELQLCDVMSIHKYLKVHPNQVQRLNTSRHLSNCIHRATFSRCCPFVQVAQAHQQEWRAGGQRHAEGGVQRQHIVVQRLAVCGVPHHGAEARQAAVAVRIDRHPLFTCVFVQW